MQNVSQLLSGLQFIANAMQEACYNQSSYFKPERKVWDAREPTGEKSVGAII